MTLDEYEAICITRDERYAPASRDVYAGGRKIVRFKQWPPDLKHTRVIRTPTVGTTVRGCMIPHRDPVDSHTAKAEVTIENKHVNRPARPAPLSAPRASVARVWRLDVVRVLSFLSPRQAVYGAMATGFEAGSFEMHASTTNRAMFRLISGQWVVTKQIWLSATVNMLPIPRSAATRGRDRRYRPVQHRIVNHGTRGEEAVML